MAFDSSSNPEIVGQGGELFERAEEIPHLLKKIVDHYFEYTQGISLPSLEETAEYYLEFMRAIHEKVGKGEYTPKRLGAGGHFAMLFKLLTWRAYGRATALRGRAASQAYDS